MSDQVEIGAMKVNGKVYALTISVETVRTLMGMAEMCNGPVRLVTTINATAAAYVPNDSDWRGKLAERLDRTHGAGS